ncbi:E3 ubiquitin-protein ligase UBR3 [Manis javanica]|nr:E3 ubiquitin-protein ligase UBR3 [Manis javanica]
MKCALFDQLFHVLALHMRLYSIDSEYNPWRKLTQLLGDMNSQTEVLNYYWVLPFLERRNQEFQESSGNEEQQPEVPILYHDVTSLLLIQILMVPQPLCKGLLCHYDHTI